MKVTSKILVFPTNQLMLGFNYESNNVVSNPNNYDPTEDYPQVHIIEIGLLLIVIKLSFWEGY